MIMDSKLSVRNSHDLVSLFTHTIKRDERFKKELEIANKVKTENFYQTYRLVQTPTLWRV